MRINWEQMTWVPNSNILLGDLHRPTGRCFDIFRRRSGKYHNGFLAALGKMREATVLGPAIAGHPAVLLTATKSHLNRVFIYPILVGSYTWKENGGNCGLRYVRYLDLRSQQDANMICYLLMCKIGLFMHPSNTDWNTKSWTQCCNFLLIQRSTAKALVRQICNFA